MRLSGWMIARNRPVPGIGYGWLAAALLLLALGLATLYSASFYRAVADGDGEFAFFRQQLVGAGLGLFALLVASRIDPRRWIDLAPLSYLVALVFLLLVWSPIGVSVNGSHRWVDAGVTFQASELAKWSVPLLVIWYLRRYGDLGGTQDRLTVHVNLVLITSVLIVVGLVLVQPDLGTAAFLLAVSLLVMLCAGVPLRYALGLGLVGSPVLLLELRERWAEVLQRFDGLLRPDAVPQVRHALNAIRSGGIDGVGFGRGTEKTLFLHAEFSDFIFAVFAEETGLIGVGLLLALFVGLLIQGWRIVVAQRDFHLRLLGVAIVCNLVLQAIINLAVNTALAPTKGIALPFVSHGSTGLVMALFQVGVLVAISRVPDPASELAAVPSAARRRARVPA